MILFKPTYRLHNRSGAPDAIFEHASHFKAALVMTTLPGEKAEALRKALAKEA